MLRLAYPGNSRFVRLRQAVSLWLCFALTPLVPAGILLGQNAAPLLSIVIVEGEGAINNIKQRTAREPIVEVQDENHRPVAGAAVLFTLPGNGPGAVFAQGARTATFISDQNGRVVAQGLRVNRVSGRFQIRVTASSQGRTATTVISQTNVVGVGAASTGALGLSLKTILIIAGIAAGATGGAYAATHTGSSKSNTTIVLGPPTVGAPK